jgi:hypothetical protein
MKGSWTWLFNELLGFSRIRDFCLRRLFLACFTVSIALRLGLNDPVIEGVCELESEPGYLIWQFLANPYC